MAIPVSKLALALALGFALAACGDDPEDNGPGGTIEDAENHDDGSNAGNSGDDDDDMGDDDMGQGSGPSGRGDCAGKAENASCTEDDGFGTFTGYCCLTSDGDLSCWEDPC